MLGNTDQSKTIQGAPDLSFDFLESRTQARKKSNLPYFEKYVISLVVLFWNILELPDLEDIDRIASQNDTCTMRTLISVLEAAYYFDDKALKDATLNTLRSYVKKDGFLLEESMVVVQGAFERVGGPAGQYDLLRKIFLTAAAIQVHALFELSLRQNNGIDNLGRAWKALKQTPAFSKDWEMAVYWYLTNASER